MNIAQKAMTFVATITLVACASQAPTAGNERAEGVYCDSERATGTNIASKNCRSTAQRDQEKTEAQNALGTAIKGSTTSGRL